MRELPEPDPWKRESAEYSRAEMAAFARQAVAAAMERAAQICDNYAPSEVYDPERLIQEGAARELADQIRRAAAPEGRDE